MTFVIIFFVGVAGFHLWMLCRVSQVTNESISSLIHTTGPGINELTDHELRLRLHVTDDVFGLVMSLGFALIVVMLFLVSRWQVRQGLLFGKMAARLQELGELKGPGVQ
jgi:hypothetical protein